MQERAKRWNTGYYEIIMQREKTEETGQQKNNNITAGGNCTN